MKTILHLILGVVLAMAIVWTPLLAGEAAGEPIKIGVILPFTGEFAPEGDTALAGVRARLKEVNAEGGIRGRPLELVVGDNESKPEVGARLVDEMADAGVLAVVGPITSGQAFAMKPVAARRQLPCVATNATHDDVTDPDSWVFRSIFPNSFQASAMASFIRQDRGVDRVAVVFDQRHPYSRDLASQFKTDFERLGGTVVLSAAYTVGIFDQQKDFEAQLERIVGELIAANPGMVFAPTYFEEAAPLVRAAGAAGLEARFAAPDSWNNEIVYKSAGNNLQGCFIAGSFSLDDPDPAVRRFIRLMEENDAEHVDGGMALGYDATSMIVEAVRSSGMTGEEIRRGLLNLKDFPLVTGRITITPKGESDKDVVIFEVRRETGNLFHAQMLKRVRPGNNE
ncbi:MAG: ABC transporter substrate-binding protein [Planctomycetes bacterium]|nr:ABC transporter substrate-binding protein [Planctomycetota bacterium]